MPAMLLHTALLVTCASLALHHILADDMNHFPCFQDMCRRGEQYCVEERQRCYLCADIVHLCNTSKIPRDCDSTCVRVLLEKALMKEAKVSGQLNETNMELLNEQGKNSNMKAEIKELKMKVNSLTEENDGLTVKLNRSGKYEPAYEETLRESQHNHKMFTIACIVATLFLMVAVSLSVTACCTLCPRKRPRSSSQENSEPGIKRPHDWSASPDHVPLIEAGQNPLSKATVESTKAAGSITINGDVKVDRLQLHDRNVNQCNSEHVGNPPEYQTFLEKQSDNISVEKVQDVENAIDVNKIVPDNGTTPAFLKNIQPSDDYVKTPATLDLGLQGTTS